MTDDRAELEAKLKQMEEEMARLRAQLSGTGSIAQDHSTAVTATSGGTAIGTIKGNAYFGPPPRNDKEALAIFRRVIRQAAGQLPLRGIDLDASDPAAGKPPLSLVNVYIDLNTTTQKSTEGRPGKRSNQGDELPDWLRDFGEKSRPVTALEAVIDNRGLVLLGDPGSGKSTFVNHLTTCLAAHALEPEAGWLKHLTGWPAAEAKLLPLPVVLRDFAQSLPQPLPRLAATPDHLWRFITSRLRAQNLEFAAAPLATALEQGRALVLLDGLDEVPTVAQRQFVRDAVQAFIDRYPANRYLITCRTLSYQPPATRKEPDLRLPPQIPTAELAAFNDEQIDRFIEAWYAELTAQGSVRAQDRETLTGQLRQAVRRPDIWRLASNPLLLTVIALVHAHKGRLPDARALLYEETVDLLLWRWEQIKVDRQHDASQLRQLLLAADRTEMDLKKVLWQLAYQAHAAGATGAEQQLAGIGQWTLQKELAGLKNNDLNWAGEIINTIKLRAGLLLEREPEIFTFPHRTFQEYLAGAHLSTQAQFTRQAVGLAAQDALWREVILLAVGRLVYLAGDTDKPLLLVSELCPAQAVAGDGGWRNAWLAGEVLQEIGLNRVTDSATGRDLLRRVRGRLAELVDQGRLSPRERAEAGDVLAGLGDPRPGVGLRPDGLPDIAWCTVPAGKFIRGSKDDKSESPQQLIELAAFQISRYPITNAQYAAFVADGGYTDTWRSCWTTAGWQWKEDKTKPDTFGGVYDLPNHPVVMVRWYEAVAYCAWLTERLRASGLIDHRQTVSLPSESQWEKAARGADGRTYPWGDKIDPERANYSDTGIGTTSAVGCFPGGVSPNGVLEMSGNVWEWCQTKFEDSYQKYKDDNDKQGNFRRVLRGGAFFFNAQFVRCAARYWDLPSHGDSNLGFRVMLSPFF